jgi:hypothetical protein
VHVIDLLFLDEIDFMYVVIIQNNGRVYSKSYYLKLAIVTCSRLGA